MISLHADLHTHTISSGHAYGSVKEMIEGAAEKGLDLIAITDHAPAMPGSCQALHFSNLRSIPRQVKGVTVLRGVEANVLNRRGTLDLPDRILRRLDWVIASLHDNVLFPEPGTSCTELYLTLAENPMVDMIGHPDSPGRLLLAVLTDDEEYLAEPSQRVRDRARPRWLEAQGWAVYTALSMALFIDPEKEASAIVDSVLDALEKLHATQDEPVVAIPERVVDDEAAEERVEEASSAEPTSGSEESEDGSEEPVAPRMPMLDDGLDEESKRRKKADEDTTGMLLAIKRKERASEENRGPRPAIAKGLPLAAYSDDQLDEMAAWVRSDGVERTDLETAEELREALGITRRGFQSDAVLGNVVRRTKPAAAREAGESSASEDAQAESSDSEGSTDE